MDHRAALDLMMWICGMGAVFCLNMAAVLYLKEIAENTKQIAKNTKRGRDE